MVLQKSIHLLASIRSDIWLEQFLLFCISGLDLKTGDEGLLRQCDVSLAIPIYALFNYANLSRNRHAVTVTFSHLHYNVIQRVCEAIRAKTTK